MTRPSSLQSTDHDLQIDRALDALRTTEAPSLLTQRVLANLHQRTAAQQPSRPRRMAWSLLATPIAVATLFPMAILMLHTHHVAPKIASTSSPQGTLGSPSNGKATTATNLAFASNSSNLSSFRVAGGSASPPVAAHRSQTTESAQAETDPAYLPSFPAPPMPLTAEERYLRTLARHGTEEETAQLNPTVRSAALAADTAEYLAFFAPPPLLPEVQLQLSYIQSQGVSQ